MIRVKVRVRVNETCQFNKLKYCLDNEIYYIDINITYIDQQITIKRQQRERVRLIHHSHSFEIETCAIRKRKMIKNIDIIKCLLYNRKSHTHTLHNINHIHILYLLACLCNPIKIKINNNNFPGKNKTKPGKMNGIQIKRFDLEITIWARNQTRNQIKPETKMNNFLGENAKYNV